MAYLIDSDWLIDHLENDMVAVQLLETLTPSGIAVSIISYMEAFQGVDRSPNPAVAEAKVRAFISQVPVLPTSLAVAERCARMRESLRQRGRRVQPRALDLLIAATAIEHGLTLVTRNKADYRDIPGLVLYYLDASSPNHSIQAA